MFSYALLYCDGFTRAPAMKSLASGASASRPSKSLNSPLERFERTGDRALIFLLML
jgi:hypothetical protein